MTTLAIIQLTNSDAPELAALTKSVGWGTSLLTWQDMLSLPGCAIYGHRTEKGELISSAAVLFFGTQAYIGKMLVRPDYQKQGFAKQLIKHCISVIGPGRAIMLVASDDGKPVYEKAGFRAVCEVRHVTANGETGYYRKPDADFTIQPFSASDRQAIYELDRTATGGDRGAVIDTGLKNARQCFVAKSGGSVSGFAILPPEPAKEMLGPVIAQTDHMAAVLITNLAQNAGYRVSLDIPAEKTELLALLQNNGFALGDRATVMIYGAADVPGRREHIYALVSRSYG